MVERALNSFDADLQYRTSGGGDALFVLLCGLLDTLLPAPYDGYMAGVLPGHLAPA